MLLACAVVGSPVRIAVLGDRTGGADDGLWNRTIRAIVLMEPDLVVSVGDLIEGYRDSSAAAREWPDVIESLTPLDGFELVATPGNHDIWDRASAQLWREVTGWPVEGVIRRCGVDFVIWDTSRDGRLTPALLQGLDSLLAGTGENRHIVVVTHRPLWSMADADTALAGRFYGLLRRRGVDVVLSGHVHAAACQRRSGTLLATIGPSGTRIPEASLEGGIFTQFGWLTLGEGPPGLAIIETKAVHPESLNTPVEQNLRYLYTNRMIDTDPLSPEGGEVAVTLRPQEEVERVVTLEVRGEGWEVAPLRTETLLQGSPDTLSLRTARGAELFPLPRVEARVLYGPRDKQLEITRILPLARPVPFASCEAVADGVIGSGEYPGEAMTRFAGRDGGVSNVPPTEVRVSLGEDSMLVAFECEGRPESDEAGLIVSGGEGSRMIFSGPEAETTAYLRRAGAGKSPWTDGWGLSMSASEDGWVMEVALDVSRLGGPEGIRLNVFRSAEWRFGCWSWPLSWDRDLMGPLAAGAGED